MSAPRRAARPDTSRWFFLGFFLIVGAVLAYGAWTQASGYWALGSRGERAEAVVAGYEESRGRRSTTLYPVFRFVTATGRRVEAAGAASADPAELPRGRRVTVVYDPSDPSNVRHLAAFEAGPGITPWILGALALLMFAGAAVFLLPPRTPKGG